MANLGYLAVVLINVGYPEQALQRQLEAVAKARTLSHPYTTAWAIQIGAWGRDEALERGHEEGVRLAQGLGGIG